MADNNISAKASRLFLRPMKRLLVSLLAILYLAAGAGFTLREHYCMGQKIGAVVEHNALRHPAHHADAHRCDRCGMEKKSNNGCCKDEVKTFKSSPDQIGVKAFSFPAPLLADVPAVVLPVFDEKTVFIAAALPAAPAHGPPLRSGVPLYLRVRCIRI